MERRRIAGFEVAVLGLGTSRLASMGSGRSKSDARTLFDVARDCGIDFIDTADTYGSKAAERWIRELTVEDRDRWVVATKIGLPTVDLPGPFRIVNQPAKKIKQALGAGFALDHATLARDVERSLRRLQRDRIEILLLHLPPAGIVNDVETHEILRDLQRRGLIAQFGVSSDEIATIRGVRDAWRCTCAATVVNPWSDAGLRGGVLEGFDVIANHVMGSAQERTALAAAGAPSGRDRASDWVPRRLLRHAAAVAGVQVVLTGTSSPEHLRANAKAFDTRVSHLDLLA